MCELLGMSANVPTDICFSFAGLLERGGRTGPHKDGWGISFYEGKGSRSFKDVLPSCESEVATLVRSYPIKSKSVISHIRQANRGGIKPKIRILFVALYGDETGPTRTMVS